MPHLSVLMSVHNEEAFLAEALDSILQQSFTDYDVWMVDDASTDRSSDILARYNEENKNLHLITHDSQTGLAQSLNELMKHSDSELIARMDGDDISQPERLAAQATFLDERPEIGVLGSGCLFIDEQKNILGRYTSPQSDEEIRSSMSKRNPFIHPSVVMRRGVLEQAGGYNVIYKFAQDYELWTRVATFTKFWNIPDPLLLYRIHPSRSINRRRAYFSFKARLNWVRQQPFQTGMWLDLLRPLYWLLLPYSVAIFANRYYHLKDTPESNETGLAAQF